MRRGIPRPFRPVAPWLVLAGLALVPASSRADLTFYTSSTAFNTAEPGLPVENFGGANLHGQSYVTESNGLSSTTNDAVYAAGSILPGITVSTLNPGLQSTALLVYSAGSDGFNVGTNWFQDTLVLSFAPGVSAVGEDVFGNTNPGPSIAGTVHEAVFNGTTLLGSTTISETAGNVGFIGVASTAANVTSIELLFNPSADVDSNTFVQDVSFGTPSVIPEPPSLTLGAVAALGLGLIVAARRSIGRRPTTNPA